MIEYIAEGFALWLLFLAVILITKYVYLALKG